MVLNAGLASELTIYTNAAVTNPAWELRRSDIFTASDISHGLMFRSSHPLGEGDRTTLIDGVSLKRLSIPGAPALTALLPEDDALGVPVFTNFTATFSENIFPGAGDITSSNTTDSSALSVSVPMLTTLTPTNGAVEAFTRADLIIAFNEPVMKGSGDFVIKRLSDHAPIETIDVDSGQVTVNRATVNIALSARLDPRSSYYVEVDTGAMSDLTGNPFSGIAGPSTWSFSTRTAISAPITGDADSGISTNITYTHTLDFGQGSPGALINDEQFDAYPEAVNGSLNFLRTVFTSTLADHPCNANHNVTGNLSNLMTDMLYNGGNDPGGTTTWTLTGLSPGTTYETRIYVRQWAVNPSRQAILVFDPDGAGLINDATRLINEDDATSAGMPTANQPYYISYTFTAVRGEDLVITATQTSFNNSWHHYGLSNQVSSAAPRPVEFRDITFSALPSARHANALQTKFDRGEHG
ncbi:MAG: hypothetical protein ACI9TH_002777 [Kiritimatiellia bacterium]